MQMLGGRGHGAGDSGSAPTPRQGNSGGGGPARRPPASNGSFDDLGDDIPFASCAIEHDVIGRRLERRINKCA